MATKVVILGGTGKMGRWFAKFFKDKGLEVSIHSRSPERAAETAGDLCVKSIESLDAVRDADIVVVSTSLNSTAKVIREASKKMRPNTILFDVASVKGQIIQALQEAKTLGIRTISVHPMFGPGAKTIQGKNVLIIPIYEDPVLIKEISGLFEGAETHIITSGEAHDTMIALTLSLPHFLNIAFGKTLAETDVKELLKLSGTTFTLQLLITEAVFSEDPDLYFEIQSQNMAFKKILDAYIKSVRETASTVKRNDREAFIKKFKEAKIALSKDPNFSNIYDRFYKAYESLT